MSLSVLIVEDDPLDQILFEETLKQLAIPAEIRIVGCGEEAQAYLQREGRFADEATYPLPKVIFLDIKMPKVNGFELLEWLKHTGSLKRIPVVMVSSSPIQRDIDRAYELGASAYVVKPVRNEELQKLFRATGEFFLEYAAKPSAAA